jgi:hypothetical protein
MNATPTSAHNAKAGVQHVLPVRNELKGGDRQKRMRSERRASDYRRSNRRQNDDAKRLGFEIPKNKFHAEHNAGNRRVECR